jgi:hypothetical protein
MAGVSLKQNKNLIIVEEFVISTNFSNIPNFKERLFCKKISEAFRFSTMFMHFLKIILDVNFFSPFLFLG